MSPTPDPYSPQHPIRRHFLVLLRLQPLPSQPRTVHNEGGENLFRDASPKISAEAINNGNWAVPSTTLEPSLPLSDNAHSTYRSWYQTLLNEQNLGNLLLESGSQSPAVGDQDFTVHGSTGSDTAVATATVIHTGVRTVQSLPLGQALGCARVLFRAFPQWRHKGDTMETQWRNNGEGEWYQIIWRHH